MDLIKDDIYELSAGGFTIENAVFSGSYVDKANSKVYHKFRHAIANCQHCQFTAIWHNFATIIQLHAVENLYVFEIHVCEEDHLLGDVKNVLITPLSKRELNLKIKLVNHETLYITGYKNKDMLRFMLNDYMTFRIYTIDFHTVREEDGKVPIKLIYQGGSEFIYFPATINNVCKICILEKRDFDQLEVDWDNYIYSSRELTNQL